jgi:hypothetical protein
VEHFAFGSGPRPFRRLAVAVRGSGTNTGVDTDVDVDIDVDIDTGMLTSLLCLQ